MKYLAFILLLSLANLTQTKAKPKSVNHYYTDTPDSLHKLWKWKSFKSLTRSFINIQAFDLDLSSPDTLIFYSHDELITSMHSSVDDSLIQKTKKIKNQDAYGSIKSSYRIIDNTLIIDDERFKNKMTYKIKSLANNELRLIIHLKIKTEDDEPLEGDTGEITFISQSL